jgi:dTDP-4-amino-4,6-dideoxygalactose transaminase
LAKGFGPGDAVFCPSFTFCATGEAVALAGATPVFVDVDEATFNIDAASLQRGIATARRLGLKPRAVIPVDLFGQSADHDAIGAVAAEEGLFVLDDAAQGATRVVVSALWRWRPASSQQSRRAASACGGRSSP